MMDGRVEAIKEALMAHGFGNRVGVGGAGSTWGGKRAWTGSAPVSAPHTEKARPRAPVGLGHRPLFPAWVLSLPVTSPWDIWRAG